jgi:hypothetical protein
MKDRLIGILIADDEIVGDHVYRELVGEERWRIVPIRPNRKAKRKKHLKKPHIHHNHKSNC